MATTEGTDDFWEIFHAALEQPEVDRSSFLRRHCADEEHLVELEKLVEAHFRDHALLDRPDWVSQSGFHTEPAADRIGGRIGSYTLEAILGQGGMGTVYAATQTEPLAREVALKVIRPGHDSPNALLRFESERQSLARMEHPNIATVFDGGSTADGMPWFAMERVDGGNLIAACDDRRLPVRTRLRLMTKVCRAVQHAHQKGIVHRDLKPNNVLVTEVDGNLEPKVIDFGVARALEPGEAAQNLTGSRLIGTPEYMAPEQFDPRHTADTRADIYALGVLLFELLTGTRPTSSGFGARASSSRALSPSRAARESTDDAAELRASPNPLALSRRLAGDLDAIVLQCLEHDPDQRYASVAELADDLERVLDGRPVAARGAHLGYRVRRFLARHWLATASAAVIAVLLTVLVVTTFVQSTRLRSALEESRAQNQRAERVTGFLTGLFRSADPNTTLGEEVSVREVLERGATSIEDELAEDPRVRAELLLVLSEIYGNLGVFEQATDLAERSWSDLRATLGENHPDTLAARSDTGVWLLRLGRLEEAETHLDSVLAGRRNALGAEHPTTLETLQNLASLRVDQNQWDEARRLLEELLVTQERVLGSEHPSTMTTLQGLAVVLQRAGAADQALPLIERALEHRRAELGAEHPRTLTTQANLGFVLYGLDRLDEAAAIFEHVVDARSRALGPDHADTLLAAQNLGAIHLARGDVEAALLLLTEARSGYLRSLGPEHALTLNASHHLARAMLDAERWTEAEDLYREIGGIAERTLPPTHHFPGIFRSGLGAALLGEGRTAEAQTILRSAVAALTEVLGPDHRHTELAQERLARAESAPGPAADA